MFYFTAHGLNFSDCGPLLDPVHGSVSAPVTTYTSVATYTCQSLWQLTGYAIRTCEADGNWAPDPPTCDDIGKCYNCFYMYLHTVKNQNIRTDRSEQTG